MHVGRQDCEQGRHGCVGVLSCDSLGTARVSEALFNATAITFCVLPEQSSHAHSTFGLGTTVQAPNSRTAPLLQSGRPRC